MCAYSEKKAQGNSRLADNSGHKSFKDPGSVTFNTVLKVILGINI